MSSFVRAIVPCRMGFRDGVGALLDELCSGLGETTVYQVVSAFNEAFNNVVQHSRLDGEQPVEIEVARDPEEITVRVIDDGVAYPEDLQLHPGDELLAEGLPERGMGLLIISRCMDRVSYERRDRNVFTMVKVLQGAEQRQVGG